MQSCKRIDELIDRLPDAQDSEAEQLRRIVGLQQRNQEAGAALRRELAAAQAQLEHVQDAYAALADDRLQHGANS